MGLFEFIFLLIKILKDLKRSCSVRYQGLNSHMSLVAIVLDIFNKAENSVRQLSPIRQSLLDQTTLCCPLSSYWEKMWDRKWNIVVSYNPLSLPGIANKLKCLYAHLSTLGRHHSLIIVSTEPRRGFCNLSEHCAPGSFNQKWSGWVFEINHFKSESSPISSLG